MNDEIRKLTHSFCYALSGLRSCMRTERNFRIHLTASVYVSIFAALGGLKLVQWAVLCLCFAMMMAAELFNTAIEYLCDRQATGYDSMVKIAKDLAAAGVFICAVFCAVIGLLFFVPGGALVRAVGILLTHIPGLIALVLSLPCAIWFVFQFGKH